MNANPFTLGHRYLAEAAARSCDRLHVIAVREDASEFPFALRLEMIKAGLKHLPDAVVHEGGDYVISKATFPAYFLKDSGMVSKNQAQLDADLFPDISRPRSKFAKDLWAANRLTRLQMNITLRSGRFCRRAE